MLLDEVTNAPEITLLVQAIRDEAGDVDTAVDAVIAAGLQETAVAHVGVLMADVAEEVRLKAANALLQLGHPAAIEFLGQALAGENRDSAVSVRRICIPALEQINPIDSAQYFQMALNDPIDEISRSALVSLGISVRECMNVIDGTNEESHPEVRAVLQQIDLSNLAKLLRADPAPTEGKPIVPKAAAAALGIVGQAQAIPILCSYLQRERQAVEREDVGLTDEEREALDIQGLKADENRMLTIFAATSTLGEIGQRTSSTDVIPCLSDTLHFDLNFRVRRMAATALSQQQTGEIIEPLVIALLIDKEVRVRAVASKALHDNSDWKAKATAVVNNLQKDSVPRTQLNAAEVIEAINSLSETEITNFLIGQALAFGDDKLLLAHLAALIKTIADNDPRVVVQRLNDYRDTNETNEEDLEQLRLEIGTAAVLEPFTKRLDDSLKTYFQEPVRLLNKETQTVWRQTIRVALIGFALRALMSVVLFAIGAYLVVDSYQELVYGNLDPTKIFGSGVSFVAGLGTMLTMIYTGPLKEIRKSVGDVGVANAAFIAYIHRILQVSHTFSYDYLQGKASYEGLREAGELVDQTMRSAIDELNTREGLTPARDNEENEGE